MKIPYSVVWLGLVPVACIYPKYGDGLGERPVEDDDGGLAGTVNDAGDGDGDGDTGGSSGDGDGDTGGRSGDGSGGRSDDGDGDSSPVVGSVGVLGKPCAPKGAYACEGENQRKQLRCEDGEWTSFGACGSGERCDTRPDNAGLCEPVVEECLKLEPGEKLCEGNEPRVCGTDLVTLEDGASCASDEGCLAGECEPVLPECTGKSEGDAACSNGGGERFECGLNLVSRENGEICARWCSAGACVDPPSCAGLAATCGPSENGDCCESPLVTGGDFYRGTDESFPASISSFRLDQYEVTVGRFRKFATAWDKGWRPAAGAGKHTHLNNGAGLQSTAGGNEPGWDPSWDSEVYLYWTSAEGASEELPIREVNWYESAAFCIWDGGFLPSEAEWEYAAAGGSLERTYPWGEDAPDCSYANFRGLNDGTEPCVGGDNVAPVGSLSPKGDGEWGQSDLAGNLWEWTFDWFADYGAQCEDCANSTEPNSENAQRISRGGAWLYGATDLVSTVRYSGAPFIFATFFGLRCARTP